MLNKVFNYQYFKSAIFFCLWLTCYLRNKSTTFVYTRFITFVYPHEIGSVYEAYFEYVLLYLYLVNKSNYVKKPKLTKIINRMK